ncbi:hypothetical protein A9Q81_19510 [Gammaproteobacteria bacterium 42_54_T18]|nr:hypothetical protein A9Q81_19510 [Gammaproteobacteria bacterium 42_54_T18]
MVKPNAKLALLPLAICIASAPALAVTNAELEQRLLEQEKKIKKMERRVKSTRNAVKQNRSRLSDMSSRLKINGFFSSGVTLLDSEDFEFGQLDIDEDYSTSSVTKLGIQMSFQVSDDVSVTGQLVSKGVDNYDVEAEWAYLSWDVTENFTARIGRQRTPYYMLSEYLDVGYAYPWTRPPIEMYNLPLNNTDGLALLYDFNLGDWNFGTHAYIGEGFGDVDALEGSFRLQNKGISFTAETGSWTFRLGYSASEVEVDSIVAGGAGDTLLNGINGNGDVSGLVDFIAGINVASATPGINAIDQVNPLPQEGIETNYLSAAFTYDNGKLLVIGEISNLEVSDFIQPAGDGGYLMVGYRFGKWMPHITYSKFYTDAKNDEQVQEYIDAALNVSKQAPALGLLASLNAGGGADVFTDAQKDATADAIVAGMTKLANNLEPLVQEQDSITLGIVYDINPRVKAKFDITKYNNFGKYNSYTVNVADPALFPATGTVIETELDGYGRFGLTDDADATNIDSSTTIYTFAIDAVF